MVFKVFKKVRAGISYSFPVYQKDLEELDKFKNTIGFNLNFNF